MGIEKVTYVVSWLLFMCSCPSHLVSVFLFRLIHLSCVCFRNEAIEQIEDMLTGLEVIEIYGNCIRLSLKTYAPMFECYQEKMEDTNEISESHELMIEVVDGDTEIKTVEVWFYPFFM